MARGGMRVLCLEKNQFTGGMASTTELIRGYRFELAGSVQFPIPNEIYDDLGFDACPIFEPDVRSVSVSDGDQAPMIFHTDPDRLVEHLSDHLGLDAVMGLAEIMNWAQAPARALGRFEVRTPPKTLDEMFACATNEAERDAIRTAMFGTVMDVVDRYLPDPVRHAPMRALLAFLSVNSTFRGPYTPGSALCMAFALASPGEDAAMSKVRGGIGAMSDHVARAVRGQRRRAPPARARRTDPRGRRSRAWRRAHRRRHDQRAGGGVEPRCDRHAHRPDRPRAPPGRARPSHRRDRPSGRVLPDALRVCASCPSSPVPTRCSTRASSVRPSVCSAPPRRCSGRSRRASEARFRTHRRSRSESRRCSTRASPRRAGTRPACSPSTRRSASATPTRSDSVTRWPSASWSASPRWPPTSPTPSSARSATRPTATS